MKFQEMNEVVAPVSDFSAGVATGIGIGIGLLALGVFC
jgi:hypothetical protein